LWFARLLRDGFALAAMGSYRPFADLAADALYGLEPRLEDDQVARVLDPLGGCSRTRMCSQDCGCCAMPGCRGNADQQQRRRGAGCS
jgi:hypothetical protein